MNILQLLYAVCFFVFLPICAAYGDPPKWFRNPPKDEKYYYGIGSSTENFEDAKEKARANLAMRIAPTDVVVQQGSSVRSEGMGEKERIDSEFIQEILTYAKQVLPGIEIDKTDSEPRDQPTDYYALVRLSREEYRKHMEREWKAIQQLVTYGDRSLESRHVPAALREYDKALERAKKASVLTSFDNGTGLSDIDIERKIDRISDAIQITPHGGNDQNGTYGRPLTDAMVVRVLYQGGPLAGFPLSARYTRGTGKLGTDARGSGESLLISTDANGEAVFRVEEIQSLSRKNNIRVASDHLPESKAVDFHYASSFGTPHVTGGAPRILLDESSDERDFTEGSKVKIEIRMPEKCHLHLFEILADGRFRYSQSVPIQQEVHGEGFRVLRRESGWALEIDPVPVSAESGLGLETILAITTENEWQPAGTTLTAASLTDRLNAEVEPNHWRAGWVSYIVSPNQNP